MPPDLNSLPPSRSPSSPRPPRTVPASSDTLSGVPPVSSTTMNNNTNASDLSRRSSRASPRTRLSISEHRRPTNSNLGESSSGDYPSPDHRSSLSHALRTASPTMGTSPIFATGDPHHQRTPSLGELHQELEQEQEAQVNRLLQMIRSQQAQLQQLQQHQHQHPQSGIAVVEDSTPPSERSFPVIPPLAAAASGRTSTQFPSSLSSHRASRPSSQAASPSLRPLPSASLHGTSIDSSRGMEGLDWGAGISETSSRRGSRDETAFYQAEASMLNRENQMLRQRIRDLERQVSELTTSDARPEQTTPPPTVEGAEAADRHASAGGASAQEPTNK